MEVDQAFSWSRFPVQIVEIEQRAVRKDSSSGVKSAKNFIPVLEET